MVNNELELLMSKQAECNRYGHRDDGRGSCAECGEFIKGHWLHSSKRYRDMALSLRINDLENRVRALEAALQSLGRKGD